VPLTAAALQLPLVQVAPRAVAVQTAQALAQAPRRRPAHLAAVSPP